MEEERRKKKNKKKKNKQNKPIDVSPALSVANTNSKDQSGEDIPEQNHHRHPTETPSVLHQIHSNGVRESAEENNPCTGADSNEAVSAPRENQDWEKEEAVLKEIINHLQIEKESLVQKEVDLHRNLRQLEGEKDSWLQKEVDLEMKVRHLQGEKDSWHQKEIKLNEKVSKLMEEKAALCSEAVLDKETIISLNDDTAKLRAQVTELEESKRNLSLENQQMADQLLILNSRIDNLEKASAESFAMDIQKEDTSKVENLNSEIEAACALVEKLVTENAELVEKVNELYIELGRWQAPEDEASSALLVPDMFAANVDGPPHPVSEPSKRNGISNECADQLDRTLLEDKGMVKGHSEFKYPAAMVGNYSETSVSGEIVQIPLDENEALDLEAQALIDQESEAVPLIDAPITGAPFRLISFFASYVSGADLVDKNMASKDADPGK